MVQLIPRPTRQQLSAGELNATLLAGIRVTDPRLDALAATARGLLPARVRTGVLAPDADGPRIELRLIDAAPSPRPTGVPPADECDEDEAYRIDVDAAGIACTARTRQGVFRALSSVAQLVDGTDLLPYQVIEDRPRFAWRGLTVDVARRFVPPRQVRELVDLCALYKLNVLHLHLTDNEGWRLEIPGLPELTAPGLGSAGDGYYSVAEFAALQQYASARFVTIVPEIDLPGHSGALRRAFPGLTGGERPPGLDERIPFAAPLDLADPATDALIAEILSGVASQTTGRFLHVGCDEAFGMDPVAFATAAKRLREIVRELGKRPLTWQEAARGGVGPHDIAQYWVDRSMLDLPTSEAELATRPELLAAGLSWPLITGLRAFFEPTDSDVARVVAGGGQVLLSPQSHLYLDRPYELSVAPPHQLETVRRLGFPNYRRHDLRTACAWDPAGCGVATDAIAGVAATVFSESVQSFADLTMLLLPRLPAIAEAAWSPAVAPWPELSGRLATHAATWRLRGWSYFASTEVDWS